MGSVVTSSDLNWVVALVGTKGLMNGHHTAVTGLTL